MLDFCLVFFTFHGEIEGRGRTDGSLAVTQNAFIPYRESDQNHRWIERLVQFPSYVSLCVLARCDFHFR